MAAPSTLWSSVAKPWLRSKWERFLPSETSWNRWLGNISSRTGCQSQSRPHSLFTKSPSKAPIREMRNGRKQVCGIKENSTSHSTNWRMPSRYCRDRYLFGRGYRLTGDNPQDLIFSVTQRSISSVGAGLRFDTEEYFAILLNGTLVIARKAVRSWRSQRASVNVHRLASTIPLNARRSATSTLPISSPIRTSIFTTKAANWSMSPTDTTSRRIRLFGYELV